MKTIHCKKTLPLAFSCLFIIVTFLFIAKPVLHDGLFHVYDNVQVTRTMAVYEELSFGQFPVRFFSNFGHGAGYFLLKYYSPLVYYLGAYFHLLGFTFIQSIKIVYLLLLTIGVGGIWLLLRSLTSVFPSTMGTIIFLLAPYLYHDFFHRGSLPEAAAFMLIPWVIWSFLSIRRRSSQLYFSLAAFSLGLTLLTHSLTGVMALLILLPLLLLPPRTPSLLRRQIFAIILGFGLAAFSFLPAYLDRNLVGYTGNSLVERGYLDHPVKFWSQAISPGDGTVKSAFLGLPLFISYFGLIWLSITSSSFRKKFGSLSSWIILVATGGFFLMSPSSSGIWANILSLRYVQFPFRFLTVVTVVLTLGYGLIIQHFHRSKLILSLLVLLVIFQLFLYPKFYSPLGYQYGTDYRVEDPCMTTGWADEHLPVWVKQCLLAPIPELVTPLEGNLDISDLQVNNNGRSINFNVEGTGSVIIAKYFFPNWQAVDEHGGNIALEPFGEQGLTKLRVTDEISHISLNYLETPLEKLSDWLSLISLCIICLLPVKSIILRRRKI